MSSTDDHVRENLTREEAQARREILGPVLTRVHLDLTRGTETFGAQTDVTFEVVRAEPTFIDLTAASVESIELDGEPLNDATVAPTRILLPPMAPGEHRLRIDATMRYQHEGKGLHRFVDPTDNQVYLHSQFEPFDAHLVFACFDQPDIKMRFSLNVDAPADWVVVSNGEAVGQPQPGTAGTWTFATTPLISPYIAAVVAGAYHGIDATYTRSDGSTIPLGLYVRRSLAEYLDSDEILDITRQGFSFFEAAFDQPYPFGKYDQLFVPEFSAGAMENPGCVTFSEAYVFRSKVTDALRERRAETILHEMAHMWFGDLVTMRWWDDLWLNESFATFMSQLAQVEATRWSHAWVTFLDALKAWAKQQDQLPSTHPVADQMPDVESVHQNFDGITYAKGASVLRQLVAWVGQEAFLAGCRQYFADHAWDNTELDDFLRALERASGRDLAAWRDEWLLTTGVNELVPHVTRNDDGTYREVVVEQRDELPSWAEAGAPQHLRRHRIAVGVYDDTDNGLVRRERVELDIAGERTLVSDLTGVRAGDVLLLNDDDLTYAKVRLDDATTAKVVERLHAFADPLPRALVWSTAWDMVRDAQLPARSFLSMINANVGTEDVVGVVQRLLMRAVGAAERYADPETRPIRLAALADQAGRELEQAVAGSDLQLAWVRHWATTARGDDAHIAAIAGLLDGDVTVDGLEIDTDLRWHLVISLAHAGAIGEDTIAAELERDPTDLGERHAATARAARPDRDAKRAAFDRLINDRSLSHTMSRQLLAGFAQLDQSAVLHPFTAEYFAVLDEVWRARSLDWAIEFSAGAFPHWDTSEELRTQVDNVLAREDLARPLRRVLLEQRDTLVRTLDARRCDRRAD